MIACHFNHKLQPWTFKPSTLQTSTFNPQNGFFFNQGTSINDVRRFSAIFDLPTLPCPITSDFGGYFGPPTYPKIGRHLWTFPYIFVIRTIN